MRVAIQGVTASFHHEAAIKWYGADVTIVPAESFGKVFELLENNQADEAVVAVENSIYGPISESRELIASHAYPVIGKIELPISQQLIGLPGTPLKAIEKIYSHPVALAQCSRFLAEQIPGAEPIAYHDTAGSVEFVRGKNDPHLAAIAGSFAAKSYGLPILAKNIEDDETNSTRFVVLSRKSS